MAQKKIIQKLLPAALAFFIVIGGASICWGKKPPWAGGPGGKPKPYDLPPVSAPEPAVLSLIAVGAIGVTGHYVLKKWRKKK